MWLFLSKMLISLPINTYDLNNVSNWTNINVWLWWDQMKLHGQCVNFCILLWLSTNKIDLSHTRKSVESFFTLVSMPCVISLHWIMHDNTKNLPCRPHWLSNGISSYDLRQLFRVWANLTYTFFLTYLMSVWPSFEHPLSLTFVWKKLANKNDLF